MRKMNCDFSERNAKTILVPKQLFGNIPDPPLQLPQINDNILSDYRLIIV